MVAQTLSLSQEQRQMMVLAPQLRQSLEMLQLPMLELRAMVRQEMDQNPVLEDTASIEVSVDADASPEDTVPEADRATELDFEKEFEVLAQLDEEWRDYFFQNLQQSGPALPEDDEKRQFRLHLLQQPESLQQNLIEQLNFADLPEEDRQLGLALIGSLDDDGYLTGSLDDLARQTGASVDHLGELLSLVQEFHPTGVAARDLRECLLLQIDRLANAPEPQLAATMVRDHLDDLGAHKYARIARALRTTPEKVQAAANLIRALDPRPGRIYAQDTADYITPEVEVRKVGDRYVVMVNDDGLPHVRISRYYRRLMEADDTSTEVKRYIRERIRSGAFLIRSIHQRQKTIQRIAQEIVNRQQDFLEHGVSRLHPMTMAEVAQAVALHETTVSRTVANKYMRTPNGVYELKFFFTPGIRTASGESVSNLTVKDRLAHLVQHEDTSQPLSDQAIQQQLADEGIDVARRTVAKYRLVLRIPPSHMRKRY